MKKKIHKNFAFYQEKKKQQKLNKQIETKLKLRREIFYVFFAKWQSYKPTISNAFLSLLSFKNINQKKNPIDIK